MNVLHDKYFWGDLQHRIGYMWDKYKKGDLFFARLNYKEVEWSTRNLEEEKFAGLNVIFNEFLDVNSKELFIANLREYCETKYKEASSNIHDAWRKEIMIIENLFFQFENRHQITREEFLEDLAEFEKLSSFSEETEFINFKKKIFSETDIKAAEPEFYELYRFLQLASINFNKTFWDYHLDLIHELFENIYPKVRDHNHLTSLLEEAERISPFCREKVFKSLVELTSKYDNSQAAKDNLLEAYFDYKGLIHKIYEEADLEIKRRKSNFHEDFIDEESDVMNSFRNGNQDNYGY